MIQVVQWTLVLCGVFTVVFAFLAFVGLIELDPALNDRVLRARMWLREGFAGMPALLPQLWEVTGFVFPKKLREQVYEPARVELECDFRKACRYREHWKRVLLTIIFVLRTALLVSGTWRVGIARKVLPKRLRDWWTA